MANIYIQIEKDGFFSIRGYFFIRWTDEFRVWKYNWPYSCIDSFVITGWKTWLPDLCFVNSEARYQAVSEKFEKVRIRSDGFTTYAPGGVFSAFCDFDLTMFPFDIQVCYLMLESWRYSERYMKLATPFPIKLIDWEENEQWDLLFVNQSVDHQKYEGQKYGFDRIIFTFQMSRKVMYYSVNVIAPSILLGIAHAVSYFIPPDDLERLSISFTCLLAYSIFQTMVVGDMPRSSDNFPLLYIYIVLQMTYITVSIAMEVLCLVIIMRGERNQKSTPPQMVSKGVSKVDWLVCKGKPPWRKKTTIVDVSNEPVKMSEGMSIDSEVEQQSLTWRHIAETIDRIVFVLYVLLASFTPVAMFVIYPNSPEVQALVDGAMGK